LNILNFIEQHKISILGTIAVHIILLVWFNVQVIIHKPYVAKERVVMRIDFPTPEEKMEKEELEETTPTAEGAEQTQALSNVVSNANQEKTTYTNSNNFSKSKADQEVWEELKRMEAEEFNSIKHTEEEIENTPKETRTVEQGLIKEDAKENDKASYGNDVKATASYYLKDRQPQRKPTPSYKCTNEGTVVIKIKVNQKGMVVSTTIDETKTNTTDDCLRNEALKYAKRWRFTQNFNDALRKEGWIKFVYVSQ